MLSNSQIMRINELVRTYVKNDKDAGSLVLELEGLIDEQVKAEKVNTEKQMPVGKNDEKSWSTGFSRKTDETIQIIMLLISTTLFLIVAFT